MLATNDSYSNPKSNFALAKSLRAASAIATATDAGASAGADAYHGTLVPLLCLSAVREFFAKQ